MNIELRLAARSDVPALQAMAVRSYHQHFPYLWNEEGLKTYLEQHYDLATFFAFLEAPEREVHLALHEQEIAGYLVDHREKNLDGEALGYYIQRIYMLAEYAGKGIGSKLIQLAEKQARVIGRQYLWLEVMQSSHDSIAFYQRKGFEITRAAYFDLLPMKNEEIAKMWIMKKTL